MDGLECNEVFLSKIVESKFFRMDSHFYERKYIHLQKVLSAFPCVPLGELVSKKIQTGHTPPKSVESYYGGNIAFVKTNHLHDNRISVFFSDYLSKEGNDLIERTILQEGDIITTIIGATESVIARSAMVTEEILPANINQNIVQIRIDSKKAVPEYVHSFLVSKYGKAYLVYLSRQTEQFNLNCEEVESVKIPLLSERLQDTICRIVSFAQKKQKKATEVYQYAEDFLLSSLDIPDIPSSLPTIVIKSLLDSLVSTGRLDAEYYQPKYEHLFSALKKFPCKPLGGVNGITAVRKSIEPGSDAYQEEGIPFVRVSDVSKFGIMPAEIHISGEDIPNVSSFFPQKDTILLSKDGSVGIAYKLEEDLQIVTSGALLHLTVRNPQEVLPDYLTLVLNSPVVQLQAERDCSGAVIQHWKPSEIQDVMIPILHRKIQKEISEKVQESFALRRQSEEYLAYAKQAVELAIEQGEDMAMLWLNGKIKN